MPVTSNDEVGELTGQFNNMVEGLRERERFRETFGRYVDESVAATILKREGEGVLAGETREATVLFTDIAGFTTIAEYLAPDALVAALNEYLETVLEPIRAHGGVVNTFIGDGLFASFNMPLACENHACAAVRAAIDIQRAVGGRTFGDMGVAFATRIGISTGHVIGGSVGAGRRLTFTLLGDTVNLAARAGAVEQGLRHAHSRLQQHARGLRRPVRLPRPGQCRGARPQRCRYRLQRRPPRPRIGFMNASGLSPDQIKLQARVRELAAGPVAKRAAEVDRTEQYPWDNVELLKDAKLLGMTIPQQYGGQGRNWLDAVLVIEALSAACSVTGRIAVETNMGAISAVMAYGSDEQKKLAADMVLSGDKPAICITEPEAGSDANGMTTRADKKGNRYVVNGRKHWITGGGVSRLHLIFAKVYDEKGEREGIGGFLAIRDETPGLKITKREPTMGLRGIPEAVIDFEDMELPPSALVMPPRGLKKGFADLMNAYNSQRVGAATVALGIAEGAYRAGARLVGKARTSSAGRSTSSRACNGSSPTCRSSSRAAQALVYDAARSGEGGFPDMLLAAQAEVFTSENAIQVVNDALQFFGARGYSRELPLERMARDVRMFTIGGGTAEVLRNVVAGALLKKKLPQTRDGWSKASDPLRGPRASRPALVFRTAKPTASASGRERRHPALRSGRRIAERAWEAAVRQDHRPNRFQVPLPSRASARTPCPSCRRRRAACR